MRTNIPASVCSVGHTYFDQLSAIRNELLSRGGGLANIQREIPQLLRETIDDVIQTSRTGRRSYEELEKTEKTYIGTRVEIMIRSFFRLPKGRLDLQILGADADVKFTIGNNWMMPREVIGHPCLLLAADEERSRCYFGLFIADDLYLSTSSNQDKKKSISAAGFAHIMWLLNAHPLPPNFWRSIPPKAASTIAGQPTGNERVMALFREVQDRPIPRDVIEATARQKDFMRRIRADGGRGTRDNLAREGILLMSGKYDALLIRALGLEAVGSSEFISHTPSTDEERAIAQRYGIRLGGG
ncbi:NaeI family type II restriction endonuclease [Sphingomonas sp. DT-207]|uniref:NaeI family type II restriction endonuclease n=1 Tax=Sphingomonas sp. DT-207 TaxID=3396167 RepID=UPI003F1C28A3